MSTLITNRQLHKYLCSRAVTDPWRVEGSRRSNFLAVIVIPALAESASLPATLDSLALNPCKELDRTLVVIVVNSRADASATDREDNQTTLNRLKADAWPQLSLAWIDAASPGLELPAKEGVGLARKIGFDAALTLLDWDASPLLISLDADTLVDRNYLPAVFAHFAVSRAGGAAIPFRHQRGADKLREAAIRDYELYLRSYLFGLQSAGSPYAYHCIGSAFACRAGDYVRAGGMNRRHAAEDFYFLQQLAKISAVEILRGTTVQPAPRLSERVPFGTGKALRHQVEKGGRVYEFVPAAAFDLLKNWLALLAQRWDASAIELTRRAATLSPLLAQFLNALEFSSAWDRLRNNHRSREHRLAAFHCWFDALRTRQLLTAVATGTPAVEELVAELLSWGGYPNVRGVEAQLPLLERLQGVEISLIG